MASYEILQQTRRKFIFEISLQSSRQKQLSLFQLALTENSWTSRTETTGRVYPLEFFKPFTMAWLLTQGLRVRVKIIAGPSVKVHNFK